MKTLIVEDDYASRKLIEMYLVDYGSFEIAVDGQQAIDMFESAHDENKPFDLVCLDIMLPILDGQEVLKKIRKFESSRGILGLDGVKVIMTTALDDSENIMDAFRSQCEAYLPKPIGKDVFVKEMQNLNLI